jgi:hypothetical protein
MIRAKDLKKLINIFHDDAPSVSPTVSMGRKRERVKMCNKCGVEFEAANHSRTLCNNCTLSRPFENRFWSNVNKGTSVSCWEWLASLDGNGYGQFRCPITKRPKRAHRIAWEFINGQIPKGKFLCHHCDNRKCVNPAHLFIGTALDNTRDMDKKGRRISVPMYGENHAMAVLTNKDVLEVKDLLQSGVLTQREIAKDYGVCFSTINHIAKGRQWKTVE